MKILFNVKFILLNSTT